MADWVNPKFVSERERMDRYLESEGLLNYQTKGMSQEDISAKYASAGVRVNPNSSWFKDNYKNNPTGNSDLWANTSTIPNGWGNGAQGGAQGNTQGRPVNYQQPQPQGSAQRPISTAIPQTQMGNRVPAIGELVDMGGQKVKVTAAIQNQFINQGLQATQSLTGQPINPNAQTDWKAQNFDWTQLTETQKAQVLKAPDFRMSDVQAMGQQGLILSDSQFNLFKNQANPDTGKRGPAYGGSYNPGLNQNGTGYGINGDLQWWQPLAYTALSNPKTTPIAQAAAMTLVSGGTAAPMAVGILGLSYVAQLKDNENPILSTFGNLAEKGMYALNWGAQTAEQVGGTLDYLSGGNIRDNEGLLDNVPIVKLYQAGKGIIEADRISNFISDPALRNAVWQAGQVYYETQGTRETALNQILQTTIADPQQREDTARAINAVLPLVRDANQVWVLGEAEPVPVQPGYTLDDAVNKILKDGYSVDQVLAEYQQAYGLSGVASDFMLQSVFDPLNVADSAVSEVKAKIVDARSQRMIDTGVMTPDQVARVEVNKIKADVYRESPSVNPLTEALPWSETARKLRASLQESARGNAEVAKVLTPWERKLAGLTPDGKIKELLPSDGGIPKFIDYVVGLRPESKARLFLDRGASVLQSLFDFSKSADMTGKQMTDLLKATANADMDTLKNAGAEFLSAPEAYTIIGAARDFIPQVEKRATLFDSTRAEATRVTQALTALEDKSILKNGLTQADWERLKKNPGDLAEGIKNGAVTFDTLKKDVDIFKLKKDGTSKVDLSFEEFQARTAAAFDDHVANWGKDYFGIQKAGQFEEAVRALKHLQSLMLLDISPTSIMNDIINERVMIATRGTLGLTDGDTIARFMDDMGVVNRDAQSAGGMGDAIKNPDPISKLTRSEGGLFTRAADAIQEVRRKLPRSQVTGVTNEAHQSQIRYAEMKKYMSRNWVEGKGFDRMPPSLEAKLKEYGYDPQVVYQNLRSTFKPDQIDLLKTRATNMDVNTFIDQAAAALGKDAGEARATLEQLGALDQLKDGLAKAQNLEQRAAVFDRVSESVVNSIDIRLAQQLKGMLENVRNKIKAEGPAGVMQVFQEIPLDYFDRKIENDNIWDDAFARAAEVDDYNVKNAIKSKAARENQAAWRRTQARQAALYIAALEGLDLSKEFGRDFMANVADEQKILQKFFQDKNAKAEQLATRTFKSSEAAASAWDAFFTQFNERFANDQRKVLDIQKKRNNLFVAEMGRMFGQKAEATARNWMDGVMNNSDTMHQMIVEFRKGLQGLPAEERARQWKEFKPEYQKAWRERMQVDMRGAGELYKWDENPPYVSDYIDRANADIQAKIQADYERRAAIDQVAQEFGFQKNTRDEGYLQFGVLRSAEYGGIPDLKGFSDPRLTPEVMREILTKRAEMKAAEAALQPELPTQPTINPAAVNRIAGYRIGDDTKIQTALKEMGGISTNLARELIGDTNVRKAGNIFKLNGRTDLDGIARELADHGYPIDLTRVDDPDGIAQLREYVQRAINGEDVYPVTHNYDRAIERDAKAYYEDQRQQEISRYVSEADTLRQALDTFDYAAPDAAQKAIDLQEQYKEWYNAPESLWDTPHNDGTLLESYIQIGEKLDQLISDTANFDRLLDATFEARENMRAMETVGEGLTKREEIHQQLKDVFGEQQGEGIATIVDARADQWAKMTGKTREEWYATYVKEIRKGGDTPTLAQFYQQVFHGSPYKFDKFSLDHMGSGEGAQAYGWGLYFAGDKAVAEWYRKKLSDTKVTYQGKDISAFANTELLTPMIDMFKHIAEGKSVEEAKRYTKRPYESELQYYQQYGRIQKPFTETLTELPDGFNLNKTQEGKWSVLPSDQTHGKPFNGIHDTPELAVRYALDVLNEASDGIKNYQEKLDLIDSLNLNEFSKNTNGQLYKVDIPDDKYLLWDKTLSEQPESVKQALMSLIPEREKRRMAEWTQPEWARKPDQPKGMKYEDSISAGTIYQSVLSETFGGDKAASIALKEAGLNGIKYLDGSSRSAGEGNYNYVVFDDQAINILETYYQMNPDGVMAKGGVDFDANGRAAITAMKSSDVSTGVHEFAHIFLEDFRRLASDALPEHAQTIKQDMNTWKVWSSVKQDGNVWRAVNAREFTITEEGGKFLYQDPSMPKPLVFDSFEQAQYRLEHELFARGFERYLYDGKAPTRALASLFERFASWMRDIYQSVTGKAINVDISPAMRDLFNRLLTDYDRVTFDASQFNVFSDGSIRPKDAPFGLERVNKEQSARQAGEYVTSDVLAKAKAEQARARQPAPQTAAPLMQAQEHSYVWQYTKDAYAEIANADGGFLESDIERTHRVAVEQAYRTGRDVPEEVLAEYPYLLKPEGDRFNAPEAQTRRDSMRQEEATRYYKDTANKNANEVFPAPDKLYQQAGDVQSPEFKAWFGDSKVVDENGDPLVVYHGTKSDFQVFSKELIGSNFGADEKGFFFLSNPKEASGYATSDSVGLTAEIGGNVMPVYVSLQKPLIIDDAFLQKQNMSPVGVHEDVVSFWDNYQSLILDWVKKKRSDGVIIVDNSFRPNGQPNKMVVAFNPEQIKSIANRGTWDRNNPNILYQQSADTNAMPTLPPGGYDQMSGYMDVSKLLYDGWLDEVKPMLDEMKKASQKQENRYNFEGMDEDTRKQLNLYLADTRGKLATSKNAARRWGDEMVDFTLLDYRRQYGFDKLFSAVVPYEFFGVRSAANWFTRVLDRPAYLSHFARIQHLQETYDSQLPERMRGKYFLPMPFLPDWAGDGVFVDPKFALFPWTQFTQPLDAMKRQDANLNNSATYILRDWVDDGTLTEQQAADALQSRSGAYWDKAIEQAKIDQGENLNTGADYFSMLFGPALYLTVPYYLATGKKPLGINSSYPSSQLPITRFGQGMETAFKGTPMEWIGNAAGLLAKPEKYARETMGLPEFGEWGDYYIDRQLANMAAEGRATPEQVQMAMIERKGLLYDQATQRVKEEMMLRIPGMAPLYGLAHGASFDKVIGSLIPSLFPGGILPPAEMEYKGLKQEYGIAWDQWENGNKQAIRKFFDAHPEYQARLALRRDPQERIEQFLKSQIWDVYGQLQTTDRKSATAQMEGFSEFLDAEPGQSFSVEQLAQWAQQLGVMVPKVEQTAPVFNNPAPRINYFAPEVTEITDKYFKERKTFYPDYWKEQNEYYALATRAEKQEYLMKHPNLKAYWDWKDDWYIDFPDLIPVFNGEVFKNVDTRDYPPMLVQMLQMYALTGEDIPGETKPLLEMAWIDAGRPYDNLDTWIEKDLVPSIRNDMMQGMVQ